MKTYSTTRKLKTTQDLPMCRMCLCRYSEMVDIFVLEEPLSNTAIIEFCTGIECNPEDGLPCVVCQECYRHLVDFFAFKRMCLASEHRLKLSQELANKEKDNPTIDVIKAPEPDDALSLVKSEGNGLDLLETDCIHPGAPYDVFSQIEMREEEHLKRPENIVDSAEVSTDDEVSEEEDTIFPVEEEAPPIIILPYIPKKESSEFIKMVITKEVKKTSLNSQAVPPQLTRRPFAENSDSEALKTYTCQICSKEYGAPASLRRHMASHQGKRFQCAECDRLFVQKDSLKRHLLLHTDRDFSCSICSKPLVSKEGLRCHLRTHHSKRTDDTYFKYKCKLCEKKFAHASGLSRHMIIHRANRQKHYICLTCNATFDHHQDLKKHSKSHAKQNSDKTTPMVKDITNSISIEKRK